MTDHLSNLDTAFNIAYKKWQGRGRIRFEYRKFEVIITYRGNKCEIVVNSEYRTQLMRVEGVEFNRVYNEVKRMIVDTCNKQDVEFEERQRQREIELVEEEERREREKWFTGDLELVISLFKAEYVRTLKKFREVMYSVQVDTQDELFDIIEHRDIQHLCHFTNIYNLPGISKEGLCSVIDLTIHKIKHQRTDYMRNDELLGAVFLSISFPNYRMLYKKSLNREDEYDVYAVILLSTDIMTELPCLFTIDNSASNYVKSIRLSDMYGAVGLSNIFKEVDKYAVLSPSSLYLSALAESQAEVLVFSKIPTKYIKRVMFCSHAALKKYVDLCGHLKLSSVPLRELCDWDSSWFRPPR